MNSTINILIVDDDKEFLTDLNLIIEGKHCKAGGSKEALRLFKKHPADVCLVDIQLPAFLNDNEDLEGICLASELVKASSGRTQIIFMSRHEFPKIKNLPFSYQFLKKPFNINELYGIINHQD